MCYNYLLTLKLRAMKNLLLTLCSVFITSFIFSQAPAAGNGRVHLKYYVHNCVPLSSINDLKKSDRDESESSPHKPLLHIATGYNTLTDYSTVCSIGQNTWHKTAPVIKPWQYINSSLPGLGFRGGYSVATGVKDNYSVLDGKPSL